MHYGKVETQWKKWKQEGKKALAILLDPDKYAPTEINQLLRIADVYPPDLFLVGGSLMVSHRLEETVEQLNEANVAPVVLFPGNNMHLTPKADAVLFLSLISGRNPELLIGQHVAAAPVIAQMNLEAIPTGYMLIEGGNTTTAAYISNTLPIPADKTSVAVATAMAGEMLGLRALYLDGGSGAHHHVPAAMVESVRANTHLPLCVGGGIRSAETATALYSAGADLLVVGNHLEEQPDFLEELVIAKNTLKQKKI